MKQRHNIQIITFISVCHYVSALEIVYRDLFNIEVFLQKHTLKIVADMRGFYSLKNTES